MVGRDPKVDTDTDTGTGTDIGVGIAQGVAAGSWPAPPVLGPFGVGPWLGVRQCAGLAQGRDRVAAFRQVLVMFVRAPSSAFTGPGDTAAAGVPRAIAAAVEAEGGTFGPACFDDMGLVGTAVWGWRRASAAGLGAVGLAHLDSPACANLGTADFRTRALALDEGEGAPSAGLMRAKWRYDIAYALRAEGQYERSEDFLNVFITDLDQPPPETGWQAARGGVRGLCNLPAAPAAGPALRPDQAASAPTPPDRLCHATKGSGR